ncbi:MAG: VCBS repeat-containing protein [Desulfamplus sp.]|nr:VCBS repeat-containing protein [Desulfamplus sp.]
MVAGELHADFAIYGSITVIGNSTSIDSKLVYVSGKEQPVSFFRQTDDLGGVIPAINQFATTINETVFHRSVSNNRLDSTDKAALTDRSASSTLTDRSASSTLTDRSASSALTDRRALTDSPSREIEEKSERKQGENSASLSLNPQFSSTNTNSNNSSPIWKSRKFNHLINGISVGDVNSDGKMETVIISDHAVFIYQFSENRLVKIGEAAKSRLSTFIAVDIADINGNGIPEIFITSMTPQKNGLNSFVVEYDGKQYSTIVDKREWYFKVTESKFYGITLLGQNQKRGADSIDSNSIYKMTWNGNEYLPKEKILDPNRANLIGATLYDIFGESNYSILAYDRSEYLTLFDDSGKELWRDINKSGGNTNKFILPKESPTDTNPVNFFPLRVRSMDINGNGNMEIFYASNHDATLGVLSRIRSLGKGVITCSSWNGNSFVSNWNTPQQKGRISDFVIADFDNDGAKELIIAEVLKDSLTAFSNSESVITAYEVNNP